MTENDDDLLDESITPKKITMPREMEIVGIVGHGDGGPFEMSVDPAIPVKAGDIINIARNGKICVEQEPTDSTTPLYSQRLEEGGVLRWTINRGIYWATLVFGIFLAISPWTPLRDVEQPKGLRETPWLMIFIMGIALVGASVFAFLMQRKLQRITLDELKQRMEKEKP